jgi:predicted AAA+ superfamily ATPase
MEPSIAEDLSARKMVFVAGPRQCGKTTLARAFVERLSGAYYSWDSPRDRRALREGELAAGAGLWAFDELHKYRRWRNWLKGTYDEQGTEHPILVTGSARLDMYGRGGDSLQGRYFMHRLHPFTVAEMLGRSFEPESFWEGHLSAQAPARGIVTDMLRLGGFPEPLLSGGERRAARWRLGYGARLVREDVRDLETVIELDQMELLFDRLGEVVGSPLSVNALREDLEVAHATVKRWLAIFERLYGVFRLAPFGAPKVRAVRKEPKLYMWDWARVSDPGARFENLVAMHLLRLCHWLEDVEGRKCELRYFRTAVGHEVDFVLVERRRPLLAVECKLGDRTVAPGLAYFLRHFSVPYAYQVSLNAVDDVVQTLPGGARVRRIPADRFLAALP